MTSYTVGMNQVMDTHQAIKELIREGLPEGQAEAIVSFQVRFLNENVATKQDIAMVQQDIAMVQQDIAMVQRDIAMVRRDIENTRTDIEAQRLATQKDIEGIHKDIEMLRAETKKDIESLKGETKKDMQLQSSQLTVRVGGMLMATVGVLVGLQTLAGIFAGG